MNAIERKNELAKIAKQVEAQIEKETGAVVEVTFVRDILVYTEDLDKEEAIIDLMKQAGRELQSVSRYDEEEEIPAGATYFFSYE